MIILNTNWK